MRWSYKTVHYALKKEGLLGSTFFDEIEMEESLNQYGKAGWELVSLMEIKDGVIAVFKQPLSRGLRNTDTLPSDAIHNTEIEEQGHDASESLQPEKRNKKYQAPKGLIDKEDFSPESLEDTDQKVEQSENEKSQSIDQIVGAIRIE